MPSANSGNTIDVIPSAEDLADKPVDHALADDKPGPAQYTGSKDDEPDDMALD